VDDEGGTGDRVVAGPADAPESNAGVTYGLAEFIAAEEMDRTRGYWWAPDGTAVLVARVDETPVTRWYIADPANPGRSPAEVGYPAAGTPNADVSLILAELAGRHTTVDWDREAFPYLVTACWDDKGGSADPLIVVQSRDQRRMRILVADRATGATSLLREDSDPQWVDQAPGVVLRDRPGAWSSPPRASCPGAGPSR
jgi:dipeptidyl-peptidase-4